MKPSAMARALGRLGGQARSRRLSAADRSRIAAMGGHARKQSLQAARRITDNFRYVAAVVGLQGERPPVRRERTFTGRLPGLYAEKA